MNEGGSEIIPSTIFVNEFVTDGFRSFFPELTGEQYTNLTGLLDEHLNKMRKGCLLLVTDLVTGQIKDTNRKLDEITKLAGLPNRQDTMQLISAAVLMCAGSRTPEEVTEQLNKGYLKGTRGGGLTRNPEINRQIKNVMRFSTLVASKQWQKQQAMRAARQSSSYKS